MFSSSHNSLNFVEKNKNLYLSPPPTTYSTTTTKTTTTTNTLIKTTISDIKTKINYFNLNNKSNLINMGKLSQSSVTSSSSLLNQTSTIFKSSSLTEFANYEKFKPIKKEVIIEPKKETRDLFTPDSLESSLESSSCISDSDEDNNINKGDTNKLETNINNKTEDSGLSISPQLLTNSSSSNSSKQFSNDIEADFELDDDEEICQINTTFTKNTNLIYDKINKINELQAKIDDINNKIKSIDMSSNINNSNTNKNYYCLHQDILEGLKKEEEEETENSNEICYYINPNYEEEEEDEEKEEDAENGKKSQFYRDRNNQTRLGVHASNSDTDEDYDEEEIDDEDDIYYNESNDDEDNEQPVYKQAQPVHKKFASTGFLFNRFGSYLDTIEEQPEEFLANNQDDSLISTSSLSNSSSNLNINLNKRGSASCFNLDLNLINNKKNNGKEENEFKKEEFSKNQKVPEDNVERLRNIRDMFENSQQQQNNQELKKVEKLQPSDKLKQKLSNDSEQEDEEEEEQEEKQKDLIVLNKNKSSSTTIMDLIIKENHEQRSINGDINNNNNNANIQIASSSASSVTSSLSSPHKFEMTDSLNNENFNNLHVNLNSLDMNRFEEGAADEDEDEIENESKYINKKIEIISFSEMNSVKTKFENIGQEQVASNLEPKPVRSITPPREGADRIEIENSPIERSANIISAYEKTEDTLPDAGYIRSRKELFDSIGTENSTSDSNLPRKKSITPPREDILKRILKETTPERLDNVTRESDRKEDVLPSAGSIKQTAAIFSSGTTRQKSIEKSGITLEGELAEKGIAKSRLALFNDPNSIEQTQLIKTAEQEADIIKNASGIAKERLSLFKNLEQTSSNPNRTSPGKDVKKLKEFTPPPQLDQHLQRQYIIIDKESSPTSNVAPEPYQPEFVPETGLAKNRMKQYLETVQTNGSNINQNEAEELQGKGIAKSLLAKWKSMENIKDKDQSPETPNGESKKSRALSKDRQNSPGSDSSNEDYLPQVGTAKNLLNKWQNLDASSTSSRERKGPRPITPPPAEELERAKLLNEANEQEQKQVQYEDELALLKGAAKEKLAKFEQSLAESSSRVRKTVTPPKEYITKVASSKTVFESQPVESNINSHYSEEDIIPSAGHAKQLKNKFLTLEKEAAKIETSSSKMNYIPKKFTSSSSSSSSGRKSSQNSNGLLTTVSQNQPNSQATEKCCSCDKTVYAMERIEADKKVYHKACFKCTSCHAPLNLINVEFRLNKPFCLNECKQPVFSSEPSKNNNTPKPLGVILIDTSLSGDSGSKPSPKSPKQQQQQPQQKTPNQQQKTSTPTSTTTNQTPKSSNNLTPKSANPSVNTNKQSTPAASPKQAISPSTTQKTSKPLTPNKK